MSDFGGLDHRALDAWLTREDPGSACEEVPWDHRDYVENVCGREADEECEGCGLVLCSRCAEKHVCDEERKRDLQREREEDKVGPNDDGESPEEEVR